MGQQIQMMKTSLKMLPALLVLVAVSCSEAKQKSASEFPTDNTGRNIRDSKNDTVTPLDQKENAEDLDLTQKIRQAVMADSSLSMDAKNVKIITADGRVTLRGSVKTTEEKANLVRKATAFAGEGYVDNQIEVEAVQAETSQVDTDNID